MTNERPLTRSQRAYLAAFEDWLRRPTEKNEGRRKNALELMLFEVDVVPRHRRDLANYREALAEELGIPLSALP